MRHEVVDGFVTRFIPERAYAEEWNVDGLAEAVQETFDLKLPIKDWAAEEGIADEEIRERLMAETDKAAEKVEAQFGPETMRQVEKAVLLQTLDHLWREHLVTLEHLRQVIGLRGYGQRDPLNEYKTEGFTLFEGLLGELRQAVTGQLAHVRPVPEEQPELLEMAELPEMEAHHVSPFTGEDEFAAPGGGWGMEPGGDTALAPQPVRNQRPGVALDPNDPTTWGKVPRNAPCPCGSGKKYKHCHGKF